MQPKPFVKWAGGKNYLLPKLHNIINSMNLNGFGYCEPMVGGGALFWTISDKFTRKIIADSNQDLINLYIVIRDHPHELIQELQDQKYYYIHKTDLQSLETYRTIRASNPQDKIVKAARIMFLLRTCFNGLMRVNKKGRFNVPPGSYHNPQICNEQLILVDSYALQDTDIRLSNVIDTIKLLPEYYFIFLDPPYLGDKKFTDYSGAFDISNQIELITTVLNGPWPFIYTNRAHQSIMEQFSNKDVQLEVIPLRHSVQPKYTTGSVEKELLAFRRYDGKKPKTKA